MLPRLWSLEWNGLLFYLNGYGFSVFCGALAALLIVTRRATASNLPVRPLLWVLILGAAGALVGSRLAFWAQVGRFGCGVLYGGLLGGLGAALAVSRRFGLPPLAVADLVAPGALLAAAFGRLGCFFAGCCFGTVWDGGIAYPAQSHAWKHQVASGLVGPESMSSLRTVPAPLLEALVLLAIFLATSRLDRRSPGRTLAACGLSYACWRFGAEFWRGDHAPLWGPLTFSQGISLGVAAASAALGFRKARVPVAPPAPSAPRFAWAQMGALLLLIAVATGSIGCSAKERRKTAKELGEAGSECLFDCISMCIDDCIDDCTEKNCNSPGEPEAPARTFRERIPKGRSPWFTLPRVEPGKSYVGRLSFQGSINTSDVYLAIGGKFQPGEAAADGSIETRIEVSELEARLGLFKLVSAPGELILVVDAKRRVSLKNATLSPETLAILKALEPFTDGFLQVQTTERPSQNWADRVAVELNTAGGKAECWGNLTLNEEIHTFRATATLTQTSTGDRRLQWLLLR
jgi:phosphatidylglycerol---prolipoprotein diacylglyceryl transferase